MEDAGVRQRSRMFLEPAVHGLLLAGGDVQAEFGAEDGR
jgi:hypothetical protein